MPERAPDLVEPAHRWVPERVGSYGDEAIDLAELAGRTLDAEQRLAVDAIMSYGPGGRWVALEAAVMMARQNGKALHTETELLTENRGWVRMADIRAGDRVFHPAGHSVAVEMVSTVELGHTCYRVTTTDGRSVVADAAHLWTVTDKCRTRGTGRAKTFRVVTLTTQEMYETGVSRYPKGSRKTSFGGKSYTSNEYRYVLPVQQQIKSADVDLPIDPYVFGAWLGDGHSCGALLTVGDRDIRHVIGEIERAGYRIVSRVRDARTGAWTIRFNINAAVRDGFEARAKRLGVWGNKHVPDQYLTAGTAQRLALLQGLMDTDGSISRQTRSTRAEFCSTNERLALAVLYLARSLGWRATVIEADATLDGRSVGRRWRVCWTPEVGDPVPFRLPRKANRVQPPQGRGNELHTVSIRSIEPVGSVPVRCIKVDSPDGLFLAGRDLIPTHNTSGVLLPVVLADLFLFDADRIVWTAHLFRTARDAFNDVCALIDGTPYLSRRVKKITYANGEEAIELHSGARLEFLARSKGGGRGLGGKRLVMDEALFLSAEAMGALIPTLSAREDPQILYGSSAGLGASDHLRNLRDRGRRGGDPSLVWVEWCAPGGWDDPPCRRGRDCAHTVGEPGCALDDESLWRLANPALGRRITFDFVRAERRALPVEEFGRERLGWFDMPEQVDRPIEVADWTACRLDLPDRPQGTPCFFIDCSPGLSSASISVATMHAGRPHIELADYRGGVSWLEGEDGRVMELALRYPGARFAAFAAGAVSALLPGLAELGVEVELFTGQDMGRACAHFQKLVAGRGLTHDGNAAYEAALEGAVKRQVGDDLWTWSRRKSADISPIVSATGAAWLLETEPDYDVTQSVY